MIKEAGMMGTPIKGDLSIPFIATKDIGDYAAKRLLALDFKRHNVQDLLGPRNMTYNEIAKAYGRAIGKDDLSYVEFSFEDFKKALLGQNMASESLVDNMNEFIQALNQGKINIGERNSESTTPTSIEDFAKTFNHVYNMS